MRFFFYGTLIAGSGNAAAQAAHAHLLDLGPATSPGTLFAIPDPGGWYPALLPGEGIVHGRLYAVTEAFTAEDLARLDAWEDFDPANPGTSLYVRTAVSVTAAGGAFGDALAYRFNQPLPEGSEKIGPGDFAAFMATGGHRAFGG